MVMRSLTPIRCGMTWWPLAILVCHGLVSCSSQCPCGLPEDFVELQVGKQYNFDSGSSYGSQDLTSCDIRLEAGADGNCHIASCVGSAFVRLEADSVDDSVPPPYSQWNLGKIVVSTLEWEAYACKAPSLEPDCIGDLQSCPTVVFKTWEGSMNHVVLEFLIVD